MTKTILFPINIKALCINEQTNYSFVGAEQNFRFLPHKDDKVNAPISDNILLEPFEGQVSLEQGIHLHWTLPELHRKVISKHHKDQDDELNAHETNDIIVAKSPDRWLITRLLHDEKGIVNNKSWILESRELMISNNDSNETLTNIPYLAEENNLPYRYLGKRYTLDEWESPKQENLLEKLDALGYGELHFSAFHPNCSSVFGFHDSIDDLPTNGEISYSVIGMYREDKDDVLRDQACLELLLDDMDKDFKGNLMKKIGESEKNVNSLFHGLIKRVKWGTQKKYKSIDQVELSSKMTLSLANTQKQAFATLKSANPNEENILSIFLEELLSELNIKKLSHIQENFFNASFNAESNGHLYELDLEKYKDSDLSLNEILTNIRALNESLNEQKSIKVANRAIRWEIFSDWYKYISALYNAKHEGDQLSTEQADKSYQEIYQQSFQLIQNIIEDFEDEEWQNKEAIIDSDLPLKSKIDHHFYTSTNPTVLLEFPKEANWVFAANRMLRNNDAYTIRDANDIIQCPQSISLSIAKPKTWINEDQWNLINQLLNESLYLSLEKEETVKGILPENFSQEEWTENPWIPFMIEWEMEVIPIKFDEKEEIKESFLKENFNWNPNHAELSYKSWNLDVYNPFTIKGRSVLHDRITRIAHETFNKYDRFSNSENLDFLEDKFVLAQELEGFNAALLMRKKCIEIDIVDHIYFNSFSEQVNEFVKGENYESPLKFSRFNPIKNGIFRMTKFRIIDIFGRYIEIEVDDLKDLRINESLRLKEDQLAEIVQENGEFPYYDSFTGYFPPRITQSARKQFYFDYPNYNYKHSQVLEEFYEKHLTPVDGWFIINYLDHEIALFDGFGVALRRIYKSKNKIHIATAIGSNEPIVINNMALNTFIAYFEDQEASVLDQFIALNNRAQNHMSLDAKAFTEIQYFESKPIAITKVKLSFELKDLPAFDLSLDAYEKFLKQYSEYDESEGSEKPKRPHRGFDNLQIPIYLGNQNDENDGLIGFFNKENSKVKLHSHFGDKDEIIEDTAISIPLSYPERTDSLIGQETGPRYDASDIVIFLNPSLSISANSGLLPVERIKLDENYVDFILKNIEYHMFTGAVLSREHSVNLPLPQEAEWQWSWLKRNKNRQWTEAENVNSPVNNLVEPLVLKEGWLTLKRKMK